MVDAQTIFEFRSACHKPGCPICTLTQKAGVRYIESTLNESILDPDIRKKLLNSFGFCYDHTWLSIELKLSDALGHAILYEDLLNDLGRRLEKYSNSIGSQATIYLEQTNDCPACLVESATLDRIITSFRAAMKDQEFIIEYRLSKGLCIPHLTKLLVELSENQRAEILLHQQSCVNNLKSELMEFIRKSDYRFRTEVIGIEGDSYKRAAAIIIGKHRPVEK